MCSNSRKISSFLCLMCHSTVNVDTSEDIRDKYKDVVGLHLCPDSHLCHICRHLVNKLWLFRSVCVKRSLEYPVLFSEKGTLNLQRNDLELQVLCDEEHCKSLPYKHIHSNTITIRAEDSLDCTNSLDCGKSNEYVELQQECKEKDDIGIGRCWNDKVLETEYDTSFINYDGQSVTEEFESTQKLNPDVKINLNNDFDQEDVYNNVEINDSQGYIDIVEQENDEFNENDYNFDQENDDFDQNEDLPTYNIDDEGDAINQTDDDIEERIDKNDQQTEPSILNDDDANSEKSKTKKSKKKSKKANHYTKIVLSYEEQKSSLEVQRRNKKYIESEFKCHSCALGFLFKDTYQAHMVRHEESNGQHSCDVCTLRFASRHSLHMHEVLHSELHACSACGARVRRTQRARHSRDCWGVGDARCCHTCGVATVKDANCLQQHLKRCHAAKTSKRIYSCNVCGKAYNNPGAVRTHMLKHVHGRFKCAQCPASFASPYTLTQHAKRHADGQTDAPRRHHCATCDTYYETNKSLLAHYRNTLKHQKTTFECPVCGRNCPNARSLALHAESHAAVKRHRCAQCGAAHATAKALARHCRAHRPPPERRALCHKCGAGFKCPSKLSRHLKDVCERAKLEEQLASYYQQESAFS